MIYSCAKPADAQDISALLHSLSHLFLSDPAGPEAAAFLQTTSPLSVATCIVEERRRYVVARDGARLAGFICLKNGSHISQFFVDPDYQGRGIGRKLWEEVRSLTDNAASAEYTVDSSRAAVVVYERFGFDISGPVTVQDGLVFVPMRRRLNFPDNARQRHEPGASARAKSIPA